VVEAGDFKTATLTQFFLRKVSWNDCADQVRAILSLSTDTIGGDVGLKGIELLMKLEYLFL
jgi:hypothetical protein